MNNALPQSYDSPQVSVLYPPPRASNFEDNPREYVPGQTVRNSYATQWYRFSVDGAHYALRPRKLSANPYRHLWPAPVGDEHPVWEVLDGFITGYWHPQGQPSDGVSRLAQQAALEGVLARLGVEATKVAMIDRHSRWLEPGVLLPGVSEEVAREVALELGEPAFIRIKGGELTVFPTEGYLHVGRGDYELIELEQAPCPMYLGYEATIPPVREGGPWVSRSMLVALLWSAHYSFAHHLVACEVCGGSTTYRPNGTEYAMEPSMVPASRYKYGYHTGSEDDVAVEPLAWNAPERNEEPDGFGVFRSSS